MVMTFAYMKLMAHCLRGWLPNRPKERDTEELRKK
jgi:hypothetical protein